MIFSASTCENIYVVSIRWNLTQSSTENIIKLSVCVHYMYVFYASTCHILHNKSNNLSQQHNTINWKYLNSKPECPNLCFTEYLQYLLSIFSVSFFRTATHIWSGSLFDDFLITLVCWINRSYKSHWWQKVLQLPSSCLIGLSALRVKVSSE